MVVLLNHGRGACYPRSSSFDFLAAECHNILQQHKCKLRRYQALILESQQNGWKAWNLPVEVGCRGFAARSLWRALRLLGIKGSARKRLVANITKRAEEASQWIWIQRGVRWQSQSILKDLELGGVQRWVDPGCRWAPPRCHGLKSMKHQWWGCPPADATQLLSGDGMQPSLALAQGRRHPYHAEACRCLEGRRDGESDATGSRDGAGTSTWKGGPAVMPLSYFCIAKYSKLDFISKQKAIVKCRLWSGLKCLTCSCRLLDRKLTFCK